MKRKFLTVRILQHLALLLMIVLAGFVSANAQTIYAQYRTIQDSGANFQGEVKIFNTTAQPVNGWQLVFTLNRSITSVFDATVTAHVGLRYTFANASYNSIIPAGGSVSFGFSANPGNITPSDEPSNFIFNAAPIITVPPILLSASAFTYQGRLSNGSAAAANGVYDFQFVLYDENGTMIGTYVDYPDTTVTNGIFTANLDFGAAAFTGGNRFLEIRVRAGDATGLFTNLTPRQPITAAPKAIRAQSAATADTATTATNATNATNAVNATNAANATNATNANNAAQLGGVAANQYVLTTDPRLSTTLNITGNGTIGGNLTVTGTISSGCRSGFTGFSNGRLCVSAMQTAATFSGAITTCKNMSARIGNSADVMLTFADAGFNYFGGLGSGWLADHIDDDKWATWNVTSPAGNFDGPPLTVGGANSPSLPFRCVY